jgi:hypothetical protein
MRWTPPQPSLKEVRAQYGENTSDEELVLRSFGGDEAAGALGKASAPEDFLSARQSLVTLVEELAKRRAFKRVVVEKGDVSVTLHGSAER